MCEDDVVIEVQFLLHGDLQAGRVHLCEVKYQRARITSKPAVLHHCSPCC
jgi:hypothetical protein